MYPQSYFVNPLYTYQNERPCNCQYTNWYPNTYVSPMYEMPNYYTNPYMDVNPMQYPVMYDMNNEMYTIPMNAPVQQVLDNHSNQNNHINKERDHGKVPFVVNIEEAAEHNNSFRTALWTGQYLQVTLMSIGVGEDIGLEVHPYTDQFLRIEEGEGLVQMGPSRENITFQRRVAENDAIMVPAGMWHNLINRGNKSLKLYTIYAPPEHPFGTVHLTKADAMEEEND